MPGEYPDDWDEIARRVKEEAGWRCVRESCRHPHDPAAGYTLTVHHLDGNKSNGRWWNLAALCQRCHLYIQGRVIMSRPWLWEHSDWFKPYVAGYYAFHAGLPDDRESVMANLHRLLASSIVAQALSGASPDEARATLAVIEFLNAAPPGTTNQELPKTGLEFWRRGEQN